MSYFHCQECPPLLLCQQCPTPQFCPQCPPPPGCQPKPRCDGCRRKHHHRKQHGFKLYHYTSAQGYYGILQNCVIQPSIRSPGNARMGEGVYLTTVQPWKSDEEIIFNNWDGDWKNFISKLDKIDYYIEFKSTYLKGLKKNKWGRKEWLHPGPINLRCVPHKICFRGHQNVSLAKQLGFI